MLQYLSTIRSKTVVNKKHHLFSNHFQRIKMSKNARPYLSKGILQMKFMQRTKEKIDLENEAAEGKKMYANEISEKMLSSRTNFIVEQSFVYCEGLSEGRYSFRGMNPEIERILELEQAQREAEKQHVQGTEVSDKEMVDFYDAKRKTPATITMEKKFQHKKEQNKRSSSQTAISNGKRKKPNSTIKEETDIDP